MKNIKIVKSMQGTFSKVGFQLRRKSPELLVVFGIAGMIGSTVMACKATTKAGQIAQDAKKDIEVIHEADEHGATAIGKPYSHEDCKKDLTMTYVQTSIKYAKLYGPAVILGAASITGILASHNIMRKRNIALTAALTATTDSFKKYRGRVVERFGEQVEKELRYGVKAKEIESSETDENGKEKKVKSMADVAEEGWDPCKYSPYAKIFDELHDDWSENAEHNMFYLRARQSQANDMLKSRGHLFLNEVYDLLGFPRTKAGAVVGWIYDPKHLLGDNYVDFGMFEVQRASSRNFMNGYAPGIVLDFNVAGNILDQVEDHQNP